MTKQLTAVVVGTGFIGPVHVEGLRRAGVHVAGIVGSSPDKSRQSAASLGLPRGYASLDEVLADPKLPETMKGRPRQTREKILAAMGSDEEVRERISHLREPLEEHIREHKLHPEISVLGEEILEKGLSR